MARALETRALELKKGAIVCVGNLADTRVRQNSVGSIHYARQGASGTGN